MFFAQSESPLLLKSLKFASLFLGDNDSTIPLNGRSTQLATLVRQQPEWQSILTLWRQFLADPRWTAEEKALRMYIFGPFTAGPELFAAQDQIAKLWRLAVLEDAPLPQSPHPQLFSQLGLARAFVMLISGGKQSSDGTQDWYELLEPLDPGVISDRSSLEQCLETWRATLQRVRSNPTIVTSGNLASAPISASLANTGAEGTTYTQFVKMITPNGQTRTLRVTVPHGQLFNADMLSDEDLSILSGLPVGARQQFIPKVRNTGFHDS